MARDFSDMPGATCDGPGAIAPARAVLSVDLRGHSLGGRPVLGGIALQVRPGETVALTGPSGIGKSTLLRCIAGLAGRIDGRIDVPARVGVVFQEPLLLPWRSALANLTLTTGIDADAAAALLAEVGLSECAALYTGQMSLGQQRRLALARAVASAPDLMLLDEPFVSLDRPLAQEMMALFARLRDRRGLASVLVTHAEDEAAALADRIVTLGGSPAEIVAERRNIPTLR